MIFLCTISGQGSMSPRDNPNFRPACQTFEIEMQEAGLLFARYEAEASGYLERRQYGEIHFEEIDTKTELVAGLWLVRARDLNHVIALFDSHPVLSSFGICIRSLTPLDPCLWQ